MAKLPRVTLIEFGQDGTTDDFEAFGSTAVGGTDYTKDIATIQSTDAWKSGWRAALIAGKAPVLQDMNAQMLVHSYMAAYMFQEGISEYDSGTTYFIGSIVKRTGTFELYGSLVNTNLGNALPSQTSDANWLYLGTLGSLATSVPQILQANTPTGVTSTSNAYVACGPTQAITLKNAANKVKVSVTGSLRVGATSGTATMTIKRGSTDLAPTSAGLIIAQLVGVSEANIPVHMEWLDTPAGLGPFTYQAFFKNGDNSTTLVFPINGQAIISVEEIGAGA